MEIVLLVKLPAVSGPILLVRCADTAILGGDYAF